MKKAGIIGAIILMVSFAVSAQNKYSQQPTNSVHNYKMPNNAKKAKELNLDKNQSLEYKEAEQSGQAVNNNANYKNSFAKVENNGAAFPVVPSDNSNMGVAGQNYKSQFKGTKKVKNIPSTVTPDPVVTNKDDNKEN